MASQEFIVGQPSGGDRNGSSSRQRADREVWKDYLTNSTFIEHYSSVLPTEVTAEDFLFFMAKLLSGQSSLSGP